MKLENHQL